jgi:hypothetical protein
MVKFVLSYFGIMGRAEPIRLTFVQAGVSDLLLLLLLLIIVVGSFMESIKVVCAAIRWKNVR